MVCLPRLCPTESPRLLLSWLGEGEHSVVYAPGSAPRGPPSSSLSWLGEEGEHSVVCAPGSAPRGPPGSSSPGWGRVSTVTLEGSCEKAELQTERTWVQKDHSRERTPCPRKLFHLTGARSQALPCHITSAAEGLSQQPAGPSRGQSSSSRGCGYTWECSP